MATLELDVRYADAEPYDGELRVRWTPVGAPKDNDSDLAQQVAFGRYLVEVPVGELHLEIYERFASGSLPPWTDRVRVGEGENPTQLVTLPRGGAATITRPEGWSGQWYLHASFRYGPDEDWQGSWGHGTDAAELTLPVLKPAEWRFQLRRESAFEGTPIVRTAVVREGEAVRVED